MPAADDLALELRNVERARAGDHDAFVALYRADAPIAWRLALALTADPELAADAVAAAFARTLAPLPAGGTRSEIPVHLRLLTATRHAVLDAGASSVRYLSAVTSAPPQRSVDEGDVDDAERARRRAAEAMQAFQRLPERWRTVLWLVVVEGIGTTETAGVLGVGPAEAEHLADRADAGLRTQWTRDRVAAGEVDPVAPEHLDRMLQTVLPLPLGLFGVAEARWSATCRPALGPMRLVLPGGRPVPRWAERSLLASTAALIAVGITSAMAVDRDPDVRRARGEHVASEAPATTLGAPIPPEPKAYLDGEDDGLFGQAEPMPTRGTSARPPTLADAVAAASAGTATSAPSATSSATREAPSPPTTMAPLIEVTAGVGHALGLSIGDQCTGVELASQVIGCAPATSDDPVTLDVGGSLLGG